MQRLFLIATLLFVSTTSFIFVTRSLAGPDDAPGVVIISEIGWSGTVASSNDEWIELYNRTTSPIDLSNWTLTAIDGTPFITLTGAIAANGFFLLERTDDSTISDIASDQLYSGSLENGGERLTLRDSDGVTIDTANMNGGAWPGGSNEAHASMERISAESADLDANWQTHDGTPRNGLDADSNLINGTPRQPNNAWQPSNADLVVTKNGPTQLTTSAPITYQLIIQNNGGQSATAVTLTDTLPTALTFVSQNSPLTFTQAAPHQLAWQLGTLAAQAQVTITLVTTAASDFNGIIVNSVTATTNATETITQNNSSTATTLVGSVVLINALHYDAYHGSDEAVQLVNLTDQPIDLTGWILSDGSSDATLPATTLAARQTLWIADDGAMFTEQFGFSAELTAADLDGNWPGFANDGDELHLYDASSSLIDTLVYKNGATTAPGWDGVAAQPYGKGSLGTTGQILYRRQDEATGLPITDSNSADDWANSADDIYSGRKARYPGWDSDLFFFPASFTETGNITISISPDNSHATIVQLVDAAQTSIQLEIFSITNLSIAQSLIRAAQRGVAVDILLEGAPPGGLLDQTRYICQQLEASGGNCWFSISESADHIFDRYRFVHAKFMIVDDKRVLISSDNFSGSSMPYDDFADGTSGRRGVQIQTDAPSAVAHLQTVWRHDFDRTNHHDILAWTPDHPTYGNKYGAPATGYIPDDISGGYTYTVRYPAAASFVGTFAYEIIQSPDNALRVSDGLLGLVGRAGAGDTLYVQQLDERPHWGDSVHTRVTDPNPRLEAYIAAARRGADVWIMLDGYLATQYYDAGNPPSNEDTCAMVETIARDEQLRLQCQMTNPTDLGIHNKMILASIDGQGFVHVGSINGTEQSSKGNREVAIQIASNDAYRLLAEMFQADWQHRVYLPMLIREVCNHTMYPLISEVFYNPAGTDDRAEFIELVNPTCQTLDLSNYAVGDAVSNADFEDVRRFPAGTQLEALQTIVVAYEATAFTAQFGRNPDFEILDSDPAVPNMIDDPIWDAAATLRLGNSGDEVLLRDSHNHIIDVITYGLGSYPGVVPVPLASSSDRSLERSPFWRDTNNGVNDMREATPSPGDRSY